MTSISSQQSVSSQTSVESDHAPLVSSKPSFGDDGNSIRSFGEQHGIVKTGSAEGSPSDGLRESTDSMKPTREDLNRMAEERAMENPEYAEAKALLEACGDLEDQFLHMEKNVGWAGDEVLITSDIQALIDNENADPKARAFAQFLSDNPKIWSALADGDNRVGVKDVREYIARLKSTVKTIKQEALAEVRAENNAPDPKAGAQSGQADATQPNPSGNAAVAAAMSQSNPKPPPSAYSGLEGASENLNNMIGWGEGEIDRLTQLMGQTNDPAQLKQLENQINQMTRRMQQMAALMNQVMTAMQNISKMYSDITMNAVRNMR